MTFKRVKRLYLAHLFAEVEIFLNILGVENLMKTVDVSLLKKCTLPTFLHLILVSQCPGSQTWTLCREPTSFHSDETGRSLSGGRQRREGLGRTPEGEQGGRDRESRRQGGSSPRRRLGVKWKAREGTPGIPTNATQGGWRRSREGTDKLGGKPPCLVQR